MSPTHHCDVLIVGGGLAGLSLALRIADRRQVVILAKRRLTEGSSLYAQGGIAAVLGDDDSFDSHIADTRDAGAGLCNPSCVDFVVHRGPDNIRWLADRGVQFTRVADGSHYHLTREGGHSHRRVIHAQDATGRVVEESLEAQVRSHPNITLFEDHIAIDLITSDKLQLPGNNRCLGLYALNKSRGKVEAFGAKNVVLATGGASKVYLYTSNPDTSTGDGIAMAWRAGCRVANLEFVQFHPTCLYHPKAKSSLVSEVVRGEGGRLQLPDGSSFMERHDPRAELAPRDVVARAIDYEMKKGGYDSVFLDISHKPADFITRHFPNIYRRCLKFGFDMTREALPVVPAAHYTCGGVMTDLAGRTDLENLYAIGESAHTGLHGANRLASNSLLECLVFAEAAAADILNDDAQAEPLSATLPRWDESRVVDPDEQIVVAHNWEELRHFMWDYVGIVRTGKRLERAARRVMLLQEEIHEYYSNFRVHNDLIELRNLAMVADLIIRSAKSRRESRGLHYTLDHPQPDTATPPRDTVLTPANAATPAWRAGA
jgi:L-aspartate oxidase